MLYLKETWNKCKLFKQVSCGIPLMDRAMAHLFGMPHSLFGTEPIKKMPAKVAMHIPEYIQEVIGLEVL